MARLTLQELLDSVGPRYQAQIRAQVASATGTAAEGLQAPRKGEGGHVDPSGQPEARTRERAPGAGRKGPTMTEIEFRCMYLGDIDARHEGLTVRLENGARYTPDWTYTRAGRRYAVEVKGAYRLGSYQRARMAWRQARLEFPDIGWAWAEKRTDGTWEITGDL